MNNDKFEYPIYFSKQKKELNKNIIDDLELLQLNEIDDNRNSLLQTIINPQSQIGKENLCKFLQYYTSDKNYLKDTQSVIQNWKTDDNIVTKQKIYDKFYSLWKDIKNDENFIDRYYYVDVDFFKFLNNSSSFLQILSLYNLMSPILSLILPLILLLVPFFMLKFSGVKITIESYYKVLVKIFSKHALGQIFNLMGDISWEKRIYALVSIGFYFFSIYQNSLVCYRFYKNFNLIHKDLTLLKDYLLITIENIEILEITCKKCKTYNSFLQNLEIYKNKYCQFKNKLEQINLLEMRNIRKNINQIGIVMKYFYEIHNNLELKEIIDYSFGLNGYMEHMEGLNLLYREKLINKCKFGKKMILKKSYFPYLKSEKNIKNNINLSKNMIITGPNASGKTTILKSVLLNQIISQSYGYGFYESGSIPLYTNIHCYLNIPDTSGRDSLFQAEARRCKEIIDTLETEKKTFCIFDELFSGTNPQEACASSFGFINYLINKTSIDFILTTHLHDLCKNLDSNMNNYHMNVESIDKFNFNYTYNIKSGISSTKGGIKVLVDLNYPREILNDCNEYLQK